MGLIIAACWCLCASDLLREHGAGHAYLAFALEYTQVARLEQLPRASPTHGWVRQRLPLQQGLQDVDPGTYLEVRCPARLPGSETPPRSNAGPVTSPGF